jgi:polyisoprenoid-binding protein YceI
MTTSTQTLSGSFTADPEHSSFEAELRHMGVGTFRTAFEQVEARLEELPDGGHRLVGVAEVESITIRRPEEFRTHVVEGEDFFDATRHPQISFRSEAVRFLGDDRVAIDGHLTMRGIEAPISAEGTFRAPVEDIYGGRRAALDLATTIDRRDWGFEFQAKLPAGGDVLSWAVRIAIHLELVQD